jgi:plastocyanin
MNDRTQRIQRHRSRTLAIATAMVAALAACGTGASPAPSTADGAQPTAAPGATSAPAASIAATVQPSVAAVVTITPIPGAPDSGVTLELTAKSLKWSTSTLEAPAGKTWHLTIHSLDKLPFYHNFIIASGPSFALRIFTSDKLLEGTWTLDLPALPAGTYTFLCAIHPDSMTGTLTVKADRA